jgi:hypothetical protein
VAKKNNHIAFILDRSGSMSSMWDEVKGGYKNFVREQQKGDNEPKFSLTEVDQPYDKVAVSEVPPSLDAIKPAVYPRGATALLDAVGKTINSLDQKAKRVMVVIFTDGFENSSREYTLPQIKALVEERKAAGWAFLFLGADQDAFASGNAMGVSRGSTVTFDYAVRGSSMGTIAVAASATNTYFNTGTYDNLPEEFTPEDVKPKSKKAPVVTP